MGADGTPSAIPTENDMARRFGQVLPPSAP